MPRACPVEHHARRYTDGLKQPTGCHGLVPWSITLVATPTISNNRLDATVLGRAGSRPSRHSTDGLKQPTGCHGLGPWRFTLVATPTISNNRLDATALGRGGSRSSLHRRSQATD